MTLPLVTGARTVNLFKARNTTMMVGGPALSIKTLYETREDLDER